jgi:FkbM family methyltransferase
MSARFLRRVAATLPSDEPEFPLLVSWVAHGDWAINVGANVGSCTKRRTGLVDPRGQVLGCEPVPETFVLLASNLQSCGICNVTPFNAAISESAGMAAMRIPQHADTGLKNCYQALLLGARDRELSVLTVSLDSLHIPQAARLVKIDAEGHELPVVKGIRETLARDHPTLIVEAPGPEVLEMLGSIDCADTRFAGSPNVVFRRNDMSQPLA